MAFIGAVSKALTPEDMAQVASTSGAKNLTPAPISISLFIDSILDIRPKARPATAAVKLHLRGVEWHLLPSCMTTSAEIDPSIFVVIKSFGEFGAVPRLSGLLSQNLVDVWSQL